MAGDGHCHHNVVACCFLINAVAIVLVVVVLLFPHLTTDRSDILLSLEAHWASRFRKVTQHPAKQQHNRGPSNHTLKFQEDPTTADLIFLPAFGNEAAMHHDVELFGQDGNLTLVNNMSAVDIVKELDSKRVAAVVLRQVLSRDFCDKTIAMLESESIAPRFLTDVPRDNSDDHPAFQINLWGGHGEEHAEIMSKMTVEHKELVDNVMYSIVPPVLSVNGFRSRSEYVYPKSRAFIRRFRMGERTEHEPHHDSADLSACYQLSSPHDYEGGFYFYPFPQDETNGQKVHLPPSQQGDLVLWNGGDVRHGSQVNVQLGKSRYMLATFWYRADRD